METNQYLLANLLQLVVLIMAICFLILPISSKHLSNLLYGRNFSGKKVSEILEFSVKIYQFPNLKN